MPQIHPTAIVDRAAELADNVVVGPFCVINGRVKIDPGTRLLHAVTLHGPMHIGQKNLFYPNVCIGYAPQDHKFDATTDGPGVAIGHHNIFREGVSIHRSSGAGEARPTTVGDHNYLMANAHLGHDVTLGNHCTLVNGTLIAGHVEIGDHATFGGGCAIHQFCRIGRYAMISGVVAIMQDVPPFCTAYRMRTVGSLNIVGLRRAGLRKHIKPLQEAFDILYRRGLSNPHAIETIENELGDDPLCMEFADFVRHTKRGICDYQSSK